MRRNKDGRRLHHSVGVKGTLAIPLACGTPLEVLAHRVKWDEMEVDEEYEPASEEVEEVEEVWG